jgi:hypothetical protein
VSFAIAPLVSPLSSRNSTYRFVKFADLSPHSYAACADGERSGRGRSRP